MTCLFKSSVHCPQKLFPYPLLISASSHASQNLNLGKGEPQKELSFTFANQIRFKMVRRHKSHSKALGQTCWLNPYSWCCSIMSDSGDFVPSPCSRKYEEVKQNNITSTTVAHVATETMTTVGVNNSGIIGSLHLNCKNVKTFRLFSHCLQ